MTTQRELASVGISLALALALASVASAASPVRTTGGLASSPEPSASAFPAPLFPMGADPPLRDPVVALGPRKRLHPNRPPTLQKKSDGVRLEVWLPVHTLGPGEWLTVHVRITNERDGPIYLLCYPTYSKLDIHELFDPGREWTGAAARFKEAVVAGTPMGINELANGPAACPKGETGTLRLRSGRQLEYDTRVLPRYAVRDQPLPGGRVPLTTTLEYATKSWQLPTESLSVRGEIELDGPPWLWPSPQEVVDAALEDSGFAAWLEEHDIGCCGGIHFAVIDAPGSIYWPAHGFAGPAPDATVVMGEFPSEVLLDPWTAQVISFDPGRSVRR